MQLLSNIKGDMDIVIMSDLYNLNVELSDLNDLICHLLVKVQVNNTQTYSF